jgi:hypothetical protein
MGHFFFYLAVAAEGRMLPVEAAQIISTALPPAPLADDNAARSTCGSLRHSPPTGSWTSW